MVAVDPGALLTVVDGRLMRQRAAELVGLFEQRLVVGPDSWGWQAPVRKDVEHSGIGMATAVAAAVHSVSARLLAASVDEIRFLAAGVTTTTTWAGPAAAGRSAAEAAGSAYWLLEPGLSLIDRASRELALRLRGASELLRSHAQLSLPGDPKDYGEVPETVQENCAMLGLTACQSGRFQQIVTVGTQTAPGFTETTQAVLTAAGGPGFYGGWSGSAHAQMWAIGQLFAPTRRANEVGTFRYARRPVWGCFAGAFQAFAVTYQRLAIWLGWNTALVPLYSLANAMRHDYDTRLSAD